MNMLQNFFKAKTPDTCADSTSVAPMLEFAAVRGPKGKDFARRLQGECVVSNKGIFAELSPRSPLSTENPPFSVLSHESDFFDLIINGTIDASIDQTYLYRNVCEMQSSNQSPSRCSFISYGEESRIDSELQFLAGGGRKGEDVNEQNGENSADGKDRLCSLKLDFGVVNTGLHGGRQTVIGRPKKEKRGSLAREGYLGPYLLKQARDVIVSGNNTQKALELAVRAMNSFEVSADGKSSLPLVMCLHVVAALHCRFGEYAEAIRILERSIEIPVMDLGLNHAVAKFAGCMQLGDTYATLGQMEKSIVFYTSGLEIQRRVLGENDSRYGETCRYLAEAYVQAFQFDEAERLCSIALEIHTMNRSSSGGFSLQEVEDRRLMGLILDAKGDYESALKHYHLARTAIAGNVCGTDMAALDCSIGDAYTSLGQYAEAIHAYKTALKTVRSDHSSSALVFIRLADLHCKTGDLFEAKSYCENAVKIFSKPTPGRPVDDIANGLVEVSAVYSSINEHDRSIQLLQQAMDVCGNAPGNIATVAGIESQMGALHYIMGQYAESYRFLKNATGKLRTAGATRTALYGIAMNQMGLACLQLVRMNESVDLFEEARSVLEGECGSCHTDTLGVYGNLAATYDAMGRIEDAIEMLEHVVEMRKKGIGKGKAELGLGERTGEDWLCSLKESGIGKASFMGNRGSPFE